MITAKQAKFLAKQHQQKKLTEAILNFKASEKYALFQQEVSNAAKQGCWYVNLSFNLTNPEQMFLEELGYQFSSRCPSNRVSW